MSEWKEYRVKDLFLLYPGATPSTKESVYWDNGDIVWITPADMSEFGYICQSKNLITKEGYESCGTHIVPPETIIISSRAPIGKVNIATVSLCTNQGCKSLIPVNIVSTYGAYYLFSKSHYLDILGLGTTFKELSMKVLSAIKLYIPSIQKQKQIVSYLDTKTAAIDKRIAVLEKKQEVYSRLRKSIINRAVTRGLNPNVPLKDSSVDWIGVIPEHWEVRRMKDVTSIIMGQSPDGKEIEEYGEIPFMQGKAEFGNRHPNAKFYCDTCTKQSNINDILMSVRAPIGDTNISDRVYGIGRGLCAIHPQDCDVYYLWYLLNKAKPHIESLGTGSTFLAISTSIISDMDVPLPPLPEQRAIADYLDEKCAKIDAAVENIGKQVDALKRLKRALINEVVTGKRKV